VPGAAGVRRSFGSRSDLQAPIAVEPDVWLCEMCAWVRRVCTSFGVTAVVTAPARHDSWRSTVVQDVIRLQVSSAALVIIPPSAVTQHPTAITRVKYLHNFAAF